MVFRCYASIFKACHFNWYISYVIRYTFHIYIDTWLENENLVNEKKCCFAPLKWPTHGFDFTTPESLKVTTSDETKKNEKEDKRVKEEGVALV